KLFLLVPLEEGLRVRISSSAYCSAYSYISSTPADIAVHGIFDLRVAGVGIALQQRRGRHDLTGLTVATLRDVMLQPGFLDGMITVLREALDGRYFPLADFRYRENTRSRGHTIDMHG